MAADLPPEIVRAIYEVLTVDPEIDQMLRQLLGGFVTTHEHDVALAAAVVRRNRVMAKVMGLLRRRARQRGQALFETGANRTRGKTRNHTSIGDASRRHRDSPTWGLFSPRENTGEAS